MPRIFLQKRICDSAIMYRIIIPILILAFFTSSCRKTDSLGFNQPILLELDVPDGPPEYKAGWYAGCKSAVAVRAFANSWVYQQGKGPEFGSGVYNHDPAYQTGWGQAWCACVTSIGTFTTYHPMERYPLSQ